MTTVNCILISIPMSLKDSTIAHSGFDRKNIDTLRSATSVNITIIALQKVLKLTMTFL